MVSWQFLIKVNILILVILCAFFTWYLCFNESYIYIKTESWLCLQQFLILHCQNLESTRDVSNQDELVGFSAYSLLNSLAPHIRQCNKESLWTHEQTWKNLKCIQLSERSQSTKAMHYCMIPANMKFRKGKTVATMKRSVVTEVQKEGEKDRWTMEI